MRKSQRYNLSFAAFSNDAQFHATADMNILTSKALQYFMPYFYTKSPNRLGKNQAYWIFVSLLVRFWKILLRSTNVRQHYIKVSLIQQ